MSALYYANTISWNVIVLYDWNNTPRVDIAPLGYIILIPNQPVFVLSP